MAVARGDIKRLIILLPPGAAKSTYTSFLFPPWYLANYPTSNILSCSYSATLAARFGKRCRNLINEQGPTLGFALADDSQAADDWATDKGGIYFAAGVGSGIAGHRADLGLIDDYIGTQEDADSQLKRDKAWEWYLQDFVPRLKPSAARVIIANRRHEDDLVGRILDPANGEAHKWTVIKIPMIAVENDPLGRKPGERLWPEWFTEDQVEEARRVPRVWAGLYQQNPAPEDGDYFHRSWVKTYQMHELPTNLRFYGGGDFAISEEANANKTCFVPVGVDENDVVWVMPDVFWEKAKSNEQVEALLALCRKYEFFTFWAEKGHISKSIGPFLTKRMHETHVYVNIEEVTPVKAKDVRARPLQGRMSMGMVRFPGFAPWFPEAMHDLMVFTGKDDKSDDFIDALAHVAAKLPSMVKAIPAPRKDLPIDELLAAASNQMLRARHVKHAEEERRLVLAGANFYDN